MHVIIGIQTHVGVLLLDNLSIGYTLMAIFFFGWIAIKIGYNLLKKGDEDEQGKDN